MNDAFPLPSLEPTRDAQATLPDLIEVLLNKGVVLHLDLIIAVADIPLIGVSLKAAIAGIETMLEYGMMRHWDEQTRAWVQRSISRDVPFDEGEELIARMVGGWQHSGLYTAWRPATIYLTDRRLFVFRREPRDMLWEAALTDIREIETEPETMADGEPRIRLRVRLGDGSRVLLSAAEPIRLAELIRDRTREVGKFPEEHGTRGSDSPWSARQGHLWYLEARSGGSLWRGGAARVDAGRLIWQSPMDARAAVNLELREILDLRLESGRSPGGSVVLVIEAFSGVYRLAGDDITGWMRELSRADESSLSSASPG